MQSLRLFSPAKLNLFLHITGRRANGYHNLQTVFQLLDHGDTISLTTRDDDQLHLSPQFPGLAAEDNLIIRAAESLKTYVRQHHTTKDHIPTFMGADIHINKLLPMGGGLGGGSSNAATTLIGLNHLWQTALSTDELATLGLQLGADVPVFVRGYSAWAEGIGETLTPLILEESWYLVIKPPCNVSTVEIFSNQELTRDTAAIKVAAFFEQGGHNDCESVVCKLYPEVQKALEWLKQYSPAQLTGTGACVFSTFANQHQAEQVLNKTPTEWECFIAKGMNHSPLQHLLRD